MSHNGDDDLTTRWYLVDIEHVHETRIDERPHGVAEDVCGLVHAFAVVGRINSHGLFSHRALVCQPR